jgi:deazaflavin-dependent oxidoreductase (nitroreductase family)
VFAAPNAVYERGLGRLLGHRFLQLTHTGRRTGKSHRVVLEVLRYDARTGEAVVICGFGPTSDWLRNLRAGGPASVSFGRGPRPATWRELDEDESVEVLAAYERRYGFARPLLRRVLGALGGFEYHGTDEDRRRVARALPLIAFRPARGTGASP